MMRGIIVFAADDGSEFSLPVNEDGTCGPMPRAGVAIRWEPPPMVGHIKLKDAQSAETFGEFLKTLACEVTTLRSSD